MQKSKTLFCPPKSVWNTITQKTKTVKPKTQKSETQRPLTLILTYLLWNDRNMLRTLKSETLKPKTKIQDSNTQNLRLLNPRPRNVLRPGNLRSVKYYHPWTKNWLNFSPRDPGPTKKRPKIYLGLGNPRFRNLRPKKNWELENLRKGEPWHTKLRFENPNTPWKKKTYSVETLDPEIKEKPVSIMLVLEINYYKYLSYHWN